MLAFEFLGELGMKNIITLLFLHLFLTHSVVTMRGLTMEEVVIAGTPPCETCEEIVCTITTIEPADSDLKYEKYIADSCQTNLLDLKGAWEDKPNATTFEECASAANYSDSKMFLFNNDQCKVSQLAYEKMDQCNINQTQMVYIEAGAEADVRLFKRDLSCGAEIYTECVDRRVVNTIIDANSESCDSNINATKAYDSGGYIFFTPENKAKQKDIVEVCDKFEAKPCAPETDENIAAFVEDLKDYCAVVDDDFFGVGLFSNDSLKTFTWTSGVTQPMESEQNGWIAGFPSYEGSYLECCEIDSYGLYNNGCVSEKYLCCYIPYFAN